MPAVDDEAAVVYLDDFNRGLKAVKLITRGRGFLKVFLKKEKYDKNLQIGSLITYSLEQKNADSIAFLDYEIIKNFINDIYFSKQNLYYFNNMRKILNKFFIYNENMVNIYKIFKNMLFAFCGENNNFGLAYGYIDFLLNVIDFFGVNIISYGEGAVARGLDGALSLPCSFSLFQVTGDELREILRQINRILGDILAELKN
jgi:ethanolamine transporter EutH